MHHRLEGLVAAVHSPFDSQGLLNPQAVEAQASRLLSSGVAAAFVCGTTGESSSLSVGERIALTDSWARVAKGTTLKIVAHVGTTCQADAIALARAARKSGAHAISAVAPSYLKPASVDDLIGFLAPVAAAAHDLPFYFYDIPALTGVSLGMVPFLDKAPAKIPQLAGIKYTNSDLPQLLECLTHSSGSFDILFGIDEALLPSLALGIRGAVGSSYNFAAPIYNRLIAAFQKGDLATARLEQERSVRIIRLLARHGYMAAAKHVMDLLGAPVGTVRSPLRPLDSEAKSGIERGLRETDLWTAIQA